MKFEDCTIGLKVVVYNYEGRRIGKIVSHDSNGINVAVSIDPSSTTASYFHPKQLRKLIKKQSEYIYIPNYDAFKTHPDPLSLTFYRTYPIASPSSIKFKRCK